MPSSPKVGANPVMAANAGTFYRITYSVVHSGVIYRGVVEFDAESMSDATLQFKNAHPEKTIVQVI